MHLAARIVTSDHADLPYPGSSMFVRADNCFRTGSHAVSDFLPPMSGYPGGISQPALCSQLSRCPEMLFGLRALLPHLGVLRASAR